MRYRRTFVSALAFLALAACPRPASADSMDPALARLVTNPSCRATGVNGGAYYNPNPVTGSSRCLPDDAAFAKLVAQYSFAFAPSGMHGAKTTGYGGFEVGIEADYTTIASSASYWKSGTQGPQDPTTQRFSTQNVSPDKALQHYELKLRKGLPFGFEVQASFGGMPNTSIYSVGADARLSLLEGFRHGIPAYFPELAAGVSFRTITGAEQFKLTVLAVEAQLSKSIPIPGALTITPYVGYQWNRVFGDSSLVDFTPNTDPLNYCGYTGANTPANPDPLKNFRDGQPVCNNRANTDFNNTAQFKAVRLTRHRIDFGLQFRVRMVNFGANAVTDLMSPENANEGAAYEITPPGTTTAVNKFKGLPTQWTIGLNVGAIF